MSDLVNQNDEGHAARQIFRPNQDGAFDDLERQAVDISPEDLAQYVCFSVTEDQKHSLEVNCETNP